MTAALVRQSACRETLLGHGERIQELCERMTRSRLSTADHVIIVVYADDTLGLAGASSAFVCGLAWRAGIQTMLERVDLVEADKLRGIRGAAVLVMHRDAVEVFEASN